MLILFLYFLVLICLCLGRHHNEIQYSQTTKHWHIPIVDRNDTWLCLGLSTPDEEISLETKSNYLNDENDDEKQEEDIKFKK